MTVAALSDQARTFAGNRVQSRVALTVKASGGRSRRGHVYEDGALRVRFPNGDDLEAVVINTAGGIAGGDKFSFEVDVGEGAALTVTTAAAEKTYRSLGDPATVDVKLNVGTGGSLYWLPQETILFNAARLRRGIEADVAEGAKLLMIESVVFGRTAMDESVTQGSHCDSAADAGERGAGRCIARTALYGRCGGLCLERVCAGAACRARWRNPAP